MASMKKDLVIGCITNYTYDDIWPWVASLEQSGYTGDKAMICLDNIPDDTMKILNQKGFATYCYGLKNNDTFSEYAKPNFSVVVERFYCLWDILRHHVSDYRFIITTDVRDVVFQTNPSDFLQANLAVKKIMTSSECIQYKNEPWGIANLRQSFGVPIAIAHQDNVIINAGVMAGHSAYMVDMFLSIYTMCAGLPGHIPGGGGPDQAAYNILMNTQPYKVNLNRFADIDTPWAAQLGTIHPDSHCAKHRIGEAPIINEGGIIYTRHGIPYCIVHQYDRYPRLKEQTLSRIKQKIS